MQKSKYEMYLNEFKIKFESINRRHANRIDAVEKRVEQVIRFHIASFKNIEEIKKHYLYLRRCFLFDLEYEYKNAMDKLRHWESEGLAKLFPELN